MEFPNSIFSKKNANVNTNLNQNIDDFDISQSQMESLIILEEYGFKINKEHLASVYIASKDYSHLEILQEGFSDFMTGVKNFFTRMIEGIKKLYAKVIMVLSSYFMDFDKFLNKYKDELDKVEPSFTLSGFDYTIDKKIPKTDILESIIYQYNKELEDISSLSKEDIIKERQGFMSTENLNKLRASIIDTHYEVPEEDYLDTIKFVLRGEEKEAKNIEINKAKVQSMIKDYPNLKKVYNDVVKEKNRIVTLLMSMQSFFEKSASIYYKGDNKTIGAGSISQNKQGNMINENKERKTVDYDINKLSVINTFFSFKFVQSKEIGNMTTLALNEKVNILKEALKFYRLVIRRSLGNKVDADQITRGEK